MPSPAGDEGNWTLYGLRLMKGQPAELAEEAAFVSLLYAHMIAAAMRVVGADFLAARLLGTLAVLACIVVGYLVLDRLGSRRAGLALAALVAFHPWSVLYSRIASVPYALAFAVVTIGPLLFVAGLRQRRPLLVGTGVLVTSLGAHFSPLTLVAAAACALVALAQPNRWVLRQPALYAAGVVAALHALPVVRAAAGVAGALALPEQPEPFTRKLWGYVHMMGTGLAGEATLRHFTNTAMPAAAASALLLPVAAIAIVALRRDVRSRSVLGGFGALYLLVGLVVAPLILAPGREWHLPANHMDRYLFALLPGFALAFADVAAVGRRGAWIAGAMSAWMLLGCTGRAAAQFLFSHGVDHGELIFDGGGGYRGWLVSDRPRATMFEIRDTILQQTRGGPATLLVADRVFIPMTFATDGTPVAVFDVRRAGIPHRTDAPYFFVVWPDEVLSIGSPPTAPRKYVGSNEALRARVNAFFGRVQLVRRFVQRDGAPLLELWQAEEPVARLRVQSVPPL
jgi:hypothetical protein